MKNYSNLSRILHRQFLERNEITNFFLEKLIKKSKDINLNQFQYIFISGLARSGTTALLKSIDESKEFASLRYKYMPFILSPKIAKFLSFFQKEIESQERFHLDGIKINANSAECLDEPFWKHTVYDNLDFEDYLCPHDVNLQIIRSYIYFLKKYSYIENKKRVLIKNNNNHLRIFKISKYLPKSKFLILFRSPLAHAKSLLRQHQIFVKSQGKDNFLLEYMNLLGHWEFGLNKKPFIYSRNQYKELMALDEFNLEYWLKQWIFTYEWIFKKLSFNKSKNIMLICYEELCANVNYQKEIYKFIGLTDKEYSFNFKIGKSNKINNQINNLKDLNYANNLYKELKNNSLKTFLESGIS